MPKEKDATIGLLIIVCMCITFLTAYIIILQKVNTLHTMIDSQTDVISTLSRQVQYNAEEAAKLTVAVEALSTRFPTTKTMRVTAYTHTGYRTASMTYPKIGTIAVDPKVIPLGTKIYVPGYGWGVAEDTGGLIKGNRLDVFFDTKKEALTWGVKDLKAIILQ
jgi:3D (Asp-Asp-Asp) domain-containing protein